MLLSGKPKKTTMETIGKLTSPHDPTSNLQVDLNLGNPGPQP